MVRKILISAASLLIAAAMLAGCGNTGTNETSSTSETGEAITAEEWTTDASVEEETTVPEQSTAETTTSVDESAATTAVTTSAAYSSATSPAQSTSATQEQVTANQTQSSSSTRKIIDLNNVEWYLILANGDNQLPDSFTVNDADIMGHGYSGYKFSLDSRIVDIWNQMYTDARDQGYNIAANSSYRTIGTQRTLFENEVSKFLSKGYSRADAEVAAARSVMYPGCSDHNLGLAVDVLNIYNQGESAKEFTWLMNNAENYGFVLRYPKDKEDITKVKYEPWHWRYVGVEAAKEMNALNMCLEEYHIYKGITQ